MQIRLLLDKCLGSNFETEVLIALALGLRRGKTLGLKFANFDFANKTVHIQRQVTTVKDTPTTKRASNETVWGLKDLKTNESDRVIFVPQAILDAVTT